MAPHIVELASETDWEGFRHRARELIAQDVAPAEVIWHTLGSASADLFAAPGDRIAGDRSSSAGIGGQVDGAPGLTLPRALLADCEKAALHHEAGRWALIYRLLWRLKHEPGLRDDPLDDDRQRVARMAHGVARAVHKMHAFVRFRPLARPGRPELHLAWFEPEHYIVAAAAPFFRQRFGDRHWAILTPLGSVHSDGKTLSPGPPATRDAAPAPDAGTALWLTYYRHIFNPARLKTRSMLREMPRHYWPNLPEAALIGELTLQAPTRSGRMVQAPPTRATRRIVPLARAADNYPDAACGNVHRDPAQAWLQTREAVQHCRDCIIGEHATQAVWGEGPVGAALMIVGEQPGDQEDLRGRPFVGPAGQLFERALGDLGWARGALYLTNAVKHFKFELRGKRRIHKTASQREAAACLQWLEREVALVRPQALLALGAVAARALLGRAVPITEMRGKWLPGPQGIPVLVAHHPSALLRMAPDVQAAAYKQWVADLARASPHAQAPAPQREPPALTDRPRVRNL